MKKYKVGIIGATGMVGQRFALLLSEHPWFDVTVLAASSRSAGVTYKEALGDRWCMPEATPEKYLDMVVLDAEKDIEKILSLTTDVEEIKTDRNLEEVYRDFEKVISNKLHEKTIAELK